MLGSRKSRLSWPDMSFVVEVPPPGGIFTPVTSRLSGLSPFCCILGRNASNAQFCSLCLLHDRQNVRVEEQEFSCANELLCVAKTGEPGWHVSDRSEFSIESL